MNPHLNKALITYRLERSKEALRAAQLMADNGLLSTAMNRILLKLDDSYLLRL
jgi:hypothetical protein